VGNANLEDDFSLACTPHNWMHYSGYHEEARGKTAVCAFKVGIFRARGGRL